MEDIPNVPDETQHVHGPEKLEIKDYDISSGSLNHPEGRNGDGPNQAGEASTSLQSESIHPKDQENAPENIQSNGGGNNTTSSEKDIPRNTPPPDYIQPTINNTPGLGGSTATAATQMETGSFWLEGNYKKIVKKVDDGAKLCDELSAMMAERAEIESLYAKKLKGNAFL